jgi:hypothetical protein
LCSVPAGFGAGLSRAERPRLDAKHAKTVLSVRRPPYRRTAMASIGREGTAHRVLWEGTAVISGRSDGTTTRDGRHVA